MKLSYRPAISSILASLAYYVPGIVPGITVVAISDLHNIPLSQIHIPFGDILIVAGDLSEGRPAQLMERLSELLTLPHRTKIVIGGNHDRALDASCDARDVMEWDDLGERQECRAAFRRAKEFGIIYLEDESVKVMVRGRTLKAFGSPKSLALSKNTAFGYSRDDPSPWDLIPTNTNIIITHGPPACYLSDDTNACEKLWETLWRLKPLLHVFGHVHGSYGTTTLHYDNLQWQYEAMQTKQILENREQQVRSGNKYIPPHLRQQTKAEATALQQVPPASPTMSSGIASYIFGRGRTQLVNAAVKDGLRVRGAIVVKI